MTLDTTYCTGKNCPIKQTCKRYVHRPEGAKYIAIFVRPPYDSKKKLCPYHFEIKQTGETK